MNTTQTDVLGQLGEILKPETGLLDNFKRQAYLAHYWTSFSPDKRGEQLIKDYNRQLDEDIKELKAEGIENEVIESYIERYKRLFESWLSAKSRCASSMITGPANFNVRKHEKANRSEENHYKIWQEWRQRAKKAIVRKSKPAATYTSELERYRAELAGMQRNHELMKEGNKRISKAKKTGEDLTQYLTETFGIAPHMIEWTMKFGFGLQNNNANMKRVEDMIKTLEQKEAMKQENPITKYTFEGGHLLVNYEADRLQIFFDSRPSHTELQEWKQKGLNSYNWSPSAQAWQRKITPNALWHVKRMLPQLTKVS